MQDERRTSSMIDRRSSLQRDRADRCALLEVATEQMDQGFCVVDAELKVVAFNQRLLTLLGLPAERFKPGFFLEEALRFNLERGEYAEGDIEDLVRKRIDSTGETSSCTEPYTFERTRTDGTVLEMRSNPLEDGGFVTTYTDVTERKRVERALRESEERYAIAVEAIKEGVFDWNVDTNEVYYSACVEALLGVSGPELKTPEDWYRLLHPNDQKNYRDQLLAHFKGETERFEVEFRYRHRSGQWCWARVHGLAVRNEEGRVYRMAGSTRDITEHKDMARALDRAETQLADAIEAISEGFSLFDTEDRLVQCNRKFRELYPNMDGFPALGTRFAKIIRTEAENGLVGEAEGRIEQWISERMAEHRAPSGTYVEQRGDGRWLQFNERKTSDGSTVAVYTDISELKRREDELHEAKVQAQEANEAKSTFLASMSHELRTPLNAIIGIAEMLSEDESEQEDQGRLEPLERIQRAGTQLLALINEILDLSKIEAGRMELQLTDFHLGALIEDAVRTVEPLASRNGNHISVHYPSRLGTIHADETRVRQIALNLIGNACKFSENSEVRVSLGDACEYGRDGVAISVSDYGIGISAKQMENLFQPFSQGDVATSRTYGGTGLGLAISQRFCQMMGGHISVRSQPGRGSNFRAWLPAAGCIENSPDTSIRPEAVNLVA